MTRAAARRYAYQTVYAYLASLIAEATGEHKIRLPSLRDLASRLDVSVSTVQHAYQLLESEGRIMSVAKSGYYAVASPAGPPLAALATPTAEPDLLQSLYHHACTPGMWALHRSAPWPGDAFGQALTTREREIRRQHRSPDSHPLGEPALRRELAARYTQATHHRWCADDVYLAADLRATLDITLAALDISGRTVMITTPASPVLLMALDAAGLDVCELPLDMGGDLDLERAAHYLRERAVALVILSSTLNGPQGALMPDTTRQALAKLLDHHGTWVLEDDDHGELCFSNETPLRDWVAPERLLVCGSFARTIGTEARYGYLLVPPEARSPMTASVRQRLLQRDFHLPPVRQKAIARLYQRRAIDGQLRSLRNGLKLNVGRLVQQLDDSLGDLLCAPMPAGGSGVWVSSRHAIDVRQVYDHLLRRHILIAPGPVFSSQGHHSQCLRIACPVNGRGLPGRVIAELRKALQSGRR
ncbi:PLP-dependent aminotransferase family protein [Pseudomonas baltica]|uniref:aminotransferase-like domain-containing protein n=1 Tax=Pseudomonas baltica TaxID=2762576 RepID=UPI0028A25183|nr:PLP-dependent aminotransferase family protein [Pseudomonas baltica]